MPPAAVAIGGAAIGAVGTGKAASKSAAATRYAADAADPFRNERGFYQNILRGVYGGGTGASQTDTATGDYDVGEFMRSNPAYNFNYDETMRAVTRGNSSKGLFKSGNMYAELMQRGSGLAAQTYDSEMNRIMTMAGATVGSPAAAGALGAQAAGIQASGSMNAMGQLGYGLTRAASYMNQPTTSNSMITGQTGYTGGAEGVISGDEWASW